MKTPRTLGIVVTVGMAAMIAYAMLSGSFSAEGDILVGLAWGKMTLVDLYGGLALFAGWVFHRQRTWTARIGWTIGLVVLGNLAAGIYVVLAARASTWPEFWSGRPSWSEVESGVT